MDVVVWRKETEAAQARRASSSSAQCFDELYRHELYSCDRDGMSMHMVCEVKKLSLCDLKIRGNGGSIPMQVRRGAANKDKHAGEYVRSLIPSNTTDLTISVDTTVELFRELRPFMKLIDNRPDVVLLKNKLPLLIVEVQSSTYGQSLSKTVVELIDQLRLLRSCNGEIDKCTGFTFPDFDSKVCVAKVKVEWKNLRFNVTFTPLTSSKAVESEVSSAITESLELGSRLSDRVQYDAPFFIPFSPADLREVGRTVQDCIERQVYSRQSIVLEGKDHFWKYTPDGRAEKKLVDLFLDNREVVPGMRTNFVHNLRFFGVPKLITPLSREDAKLCLYSLVEKVAVVLHELHEKYNVAHLDVRLENICFRLPEEVVLIDFDRWMEADRCRDMYTIYNSEMYKSEKLTMEQLDWRQLGMMIAWIINGHSNYHETVVVPNDDEFLKDLLEGKFNKQKIQGSILSEYSEQLKTVLERRTSKS